MLKEFGDVTIHEPSMQEMIDHFQECLVPFFGIKKRDMPWRHLADADGTRFYQVLVSEMMLQQTQVQRVIPKYTQWMKTFPTLSALSAASFTDVLQEWQGLGYSRRAKYLHRIAHDLATTITAPSTVEELTAFNGIGENTAGAIVVYVFNAPAIFIETNIRTVLFHHFFRNEHQVGDAQLHMLMTDLLDTKNPRQWYWAMMDYGAELKKSVQNVSKSKHYRKQSTFQGSDRQLRSALLRTLLVSPLSYQDALREVNMKQGIIDSLQKEGMVHVGAGIVRIK